ncbi:MAG TPA: serine/threonine-protein kinase [Polyangiaceae bacterium]|nr:serine/threonine-protein kinase [Polyangiaceae bacterium]
MRRPRAVTPLRPVEVRPDAVIAERYRIDMILGRSRGVLCSAVHVTFGRRVALRVIAPALTDPKAIDRFHREARILSQLESEHVARIYDFGMLEDDSLYFAREYIDGLSLAEHAHARGGIPLEEASLIFLQICEAVQEAHMRDVVLRDLQPGHIMLTHKRSGTSLAKITDVSTCRVLRRDNPSETCTRFAHVSPYAAPEILHQAAVDERADVWSLGCLLYEMLTGKPPFEGEGMALAMRMTREEPTPLSELAPGLPKALDTIMGWALAKNPDHRFQSVYGFAHEMRAFACSHGRVLIDQIAALAGCSKKAPEPIPSEEDDNALTMVRHVAKRRAPRVTHLAPVILQTPPVIPPTLPSLPPMPSPMPVPRAPSAPPDLRPLPPPLPPVIDESDDVPWMQSQSIASRRMRAALWGTLIALPLCALLVFLIIAPSPAIRAEVGVAPPADQIELAPPVRTLERVPDAAPKRERKKERQPALRRAPHEQPDRDSQFLDQIDGSPTAVPVHRTPAGSGRLAALAVGTRCDFMVDGKPVGSGTSVNVKLGAGLHRVSCKRPDGGVRNMSVAVEPGRAAVAVFR